MTIQESVSASSEEPRKQEKPEREVIIPDVLHDEARLTTEQIALLTGISKQTYEGWRSRNRKGGPDFEKLGPQLIRYRWGTVRAWLEASTVKAVQGHADQLSA